MGHWINLAGKGLKEGGKLASRPDPDTKSGFGQRWGGGPLPRAWWRQFTQGLQGQNWEVTSRAVGKGVPCELLLPCWAGPWCRGESCAPEV